MIRAVGASANYGGAMQNWIYKEYTFLQFVLFTYMFLESPILTAKEFENITS